jgi:hypothetical protein
MNNILRQKYVKNKLNTSYYIVQQNNRKKVIEITQIIKKNTMKTPIIK